MDKNFVVLKYLEGTREEFEIAGRFVSYRDAVESTKDYPAGTRVVSYRDDTVQFLWEKGKVVIPKLDGYW